jgi:CDGSH-type Zn-finger protein
MELPKRAGDNPLAVILEEGKKYAWCTCGLSESQPFCDGSHK